MWEQEDENDYDPEKERNRVKNLPVYKKAESLMELTRRICDVVEDEKDELHICQQILGNAMIIPAKIAGAEGGDLYSIRFDNATLIKLAARELLAETNMLYDLVEEKYVLTLRKEIEEFRVVFHDWVRSFDKTNDIPDEWDIKNL
jgi:hypothetical protein